MAPARGGSDRGRGLLTGASREKAAPNLINPGRLFGSPTAPRFSHRLLFTARLCRLRLGLSLQHFRQNLVALFSVGHSCQPQIRIDLRLVNICESRILTRTGDESVYSYSRRYRRRSGGTPFQKATPRSVPGFRVLGSRMAHPLRVPLRLIRRNLGCAESTNHFGLAPCA